MSLPNITAVGTLSKMTTTYTTSGKEVTKFQLECSEKNTKGEYENLYLKGEVWESALRAAIRGVLDTFDLDEDETIDDYE